MMKQLWLTSLFILCLILFHKAWAGRVGQKSDEGTKMARKAHYNYLLHLPQKYPDNIKKYPLVIYLHGSSQKGDDLNKLKAYGLPSLVEKGNQFDFIIVSPQCPPEAADWSAENWFDTLFSEITSKYRVDTDRVYLTGISMGGGGTFEIAKKHPEKFAALAPLCAWNSGLENICRLSDIPIWTLHGTRDPVVPVSETREKVARLKECDGNIKFTALENEGHSIHWLYEKQDTYPIFTWMLSHKKKSGK
jgi:predicted peptidase